MIPKQQFTLSATLLAVFLSPQIYAIEDCGTSVTECKMWQTINTQQKLIENLTEQLKKLTDKIHVSSDGKLGIGTTNPKAKLNVNGNISLAHSERRKKGIYSKTFMVNGDANTYYPVVIYTVSYGRVLNMQIWRECCSWPAPHTWNTKTHKGALTVEIEMFGSGWAGDGNMYRIKNFFQQYSQVISKIERPRPSGYWTVIWLRGGGAKYVIEGDFDNVQNPKVYYESTIIDDRKNDAWDITVAPTTKVEQTFVNYSHNFAGNVGIGTQNPKEKLHVKGTVKADTFEGKVKRFKDYGITLEQDTTDKTFVKSNCPIGTLTAAKQNVQAAICVCVDATKGKGWYCFN
jgi:hypothetical protein